MAVGLLRAAIGPGDHVGVLLPPGLAFAPHGSRRPARGRRRGAGRSAARPGGPRDAPGGVRAGARGRAAGRDRAGAGRSGRPTAPPSSIHTSGTTSDAEADHADERATGGGAQPGPRSRSGTTQASAGSARCRWRTSAVCSILHPRCDRRDDRDPPPAVRRRARRPRPRRPRRARRSSRVVPTMLARLLDAGLRQPARAARGAARRRRRSRRCSLERAQHAGVRCVTTYGLTEACSQVTTGGPPLFCTRVRIADDGEILVRSPTVAPGARRRRRLAAHRRPRAPRRRRRPPHHRPRERTRSSPGVRTSRPPRSRPSSRRTPRSRRRRCTRGPTTSGARRSSQSSSCATACTPTADELRAHVRARLAPFKVPKAISFAASLPRTASGKLLRRDL